MNRVSLTETDAKIAAYKGAGLTVVRLTVADRAKVLSDLALGTVDGFIASDPWQSAGQLTPKTVEKFDDGYPWPTATKMLNINNMISLDPSAGVSELTTL